MTDEYTIVTVAPDGRTYQNLLDADNELSSRLAIVNDKRQRKIFYDDGNLADNWVVTKTGAGSVVTAAGDGAGGKAIVMTTGGANAAKVTTTAAKQPVATNDGVSLKFPKSRPWFWTAEFQNSGTSPVNEIYFLNGTRVIFGVTVGYDYVAAVVSQNKISLTAQGVSPHQVAAPSGFDATAPYRIVVLCDPVVGKYHAYLHYRPSGGSDGKAYLGGVQQTDIAVPSTGEFYYPNSIKLGPWEFTNCSVSMQRARSYEVHGLLTGCSLETGRNTFDNVPGFEGFSDPDESYSPAALLSQRLNGDKDRVLSIATGDEAVNVDGPGGLPDYLDEFASWVVPARPKFLVLGSPSNSVAGLANLTTAPAQNAAFAQMQADILTLVGLAKAVTPAVAMHATEPRHESPSFDTPSKRAWLKATRDWMVATLPALGVQVIDCYAEFEDPEHPGKLAPWADGGDHCHFTKRAFEIRADAAAAALQRT